MSSPIGLSLSALASSKDESACRMLVLEKTLCLDSLMELVDKNHVSFNKFVESEIATLETLPTLGYCTGNFVSYFQKVLVQYVKEVRK